MHETVNEYHGLAVAERADWNLKVTAQDLPHIVEKFVAEFETYWNSREFMPFNAAEPELLREAIRDARTGAAIAPVLFDIRPHAYQERILDALEAERTAHGQRRNLVVAATGTGKTVVAAFDFKRFFEAQGRNARLLFVAHRREILEQAVERSEHGSQQQHLRPGKTRSGFQKHSVCLENILDRLTGSDPTDPRWNSEIEQERLGL